EKHGIGLVGGEGRVNEKLVAERGEAHAAAQFGACGFKFAGLRETHQSVFKDVARRKCAAPAEDILKRGWTSHASSVYAGMARRSDGREAKAPCLEFATELQ